MLIFNNYNKNIKILFKKKYSVLFVFCRNMGHLVNPIGVRLGYSRVWNFSWSVFTKPSVTYLTVRNFELYYFMKHLSYKNSIFPFLNLLYNTFYCTFDARGFSRLYLFFFDFRLEYMLEMLFVRWASPKTYRPKFFYSIIDRGLNKTLYKQSRQDDKNMVVSLSLNNRDLFKTPIAASSQSAYDFLLPPVIENLPLIKDSGVSKIYKPISSQFINIINFLSKKFDPKTDIWESKLVRLKSLKRTALKLIMQENKKLTKRNFGLNLIIFSKLFKFQFQKKLNYQFTKDGIFFVSGNNKKKFLSVC